MGIKCFLFVFSTFCVYVYSSSSSSSSSNSSSSNCCCCNVVVDNFLVFIWQNL